MGSIDALEKYMFQLVGKHIQQLSTYFVSR
jgi:hypothetical protein